jgi:hypothetical protein
MVVVVAIHGASYLKYILSGLKLTVTDLPLLMAGTVPFILVQYPRPVATAAASVIAPAIVVVTAVLYLPGSPLPLAARMVFLGLAAPGLALAYRVSGGAAAWRDSVAQPRYFFSTFIASLLDPHSWRKFRGFMFDDIADNHLPLMPATPASQSRYPDIIVIQHESVFDPRASTTMRYVCAK